MARTLEEGCVAGIDPHKRTLTVTVLDGRGGVLGTRTFKVSGDGHRSMTAWAALLGDVRVWGVEGASSLGRHTAVFLGEADFDVRDVCPTRTAEQARRRRQGKPTTSTRNASPAKSSRTTIFRQRSSALSAPLAPTRRMTKCRCGTRPDDRCSRRVNTC